ncbi:MAG: hypothetical protein ABIA83_02400 [Patescibacteria group bacterium]
MAQDALPMINARAQLMRSQVGARRDRRPVRQQNRTALATKQPKLSRSRLNMMPKDDQLFNLPTVQQRPDYAKTSLLMQRMLEAENKERLSRDRQRIRSEMQAYKLPQMMPDELATGFEGESMQDQFEQEYLQQIQSREFQQAAMQKINGAVNQSEARVRQKQLKRAQEKATGQAKDAVKELAKIAKVAGSTGKIGWDTENIISLADAIDPADLEIPSIFTVLVQMYRATTAILNNGEKFIKGPLSFIEPEPLYRFWSPDAAQKLITAGTTDIFAGGSELENTVESITLGWPEAIIGAYLLGIILLSVLAVIICFIVIIALGASLIGII